MNHALCGLLTTLLIPPGPAAAVDCGLDHARLVNGTGNSSECACVEPWTGANCDECSGGWSGGECDQAPCSGHGDWNAGDCSCQESWIGDQCEVKYQNCTHLENCSGHGACNRTDDTCICDNKFTGKRCELKESQPEDEVSGSSGGTKLVGVGLYIVNLAEDSLAMGTFYADFLLFRFEDTRPLPKSFDIREESQICPEGFPTSKPDTVEPFLVNAGQFSTLKLVEPKNITNNASYYRVQSKFYRRIDVSQWPLTVPG